MWVRRPAEWALGYDPDRRGGDGQCHPRPARRGPGGAFAPGVPRERAHGVEAAGHPLPPAVCQRASTRWGPVSIGPFAARVGPRVRGQGRLRHDPRRSREITPTRALVSHHSGSNPRTKGLCGADKLLPADAICCGRGWHQHCEGTWDAWPDTHSSFGESGETDRRRSPPRLRADRLRPSRGAADHHLQRRGARPRGAILGAVTCSGATGFRFVSATSTCSASVAPCSRRTRPTAPCSSAMNRAAAFPSRCSGSAAGRSRCSGVDAGEFYATPNNDRPNANFLTITGHQQGGGVVTHTVALDGIYDGAGGRQGLPALRPAEHVRQP